MHLKKFIMFNVKMKSQEHEITMVILRKVGPTASPTPPSLAFASAKKRLLAPVCAWRMFFSRVAYLALLMGTEITFYWVCLHLSSEQKQRQMSCRQDMLVLEFTEIIVLICKLLGISMWFQDINIICFWGELFQPIYIPCPPSVPLAIHLPYFHTYLTLRGSQG